jgi:hypothetical protein
MIGGLLCVELPGWVLGEGHAETMGGHIQVLVALELDSPLEKELQDAGPVVDENSESSPVGLVSYTSVLVGWVECECCDKYIMLD